MNITAEQLIDYVCVRCEMRTQMLYAGDGKPPAYIACPACADARWTLRPSNLASDAGPAIALIRKPSIGHP
jgi:hypothetical protein